MSTQEVIEVRDIPTALKLIGQSLWLQKITKPSAQNYKKSLEWVHHTVSSGNPIFPIGFIIDIGNVAFGTDTESKSSKEVLSVPNWPHNITRMYEDYILGKLYADHIFERASDALRRYQDKDRIKGLSYVVNQMREHIRYGGLVIPPATIKTLSKEKPETVLEDAWKDLSDNGPSEVLVKLYEQLASCARRISEYLGFDDVIALEQRTALADMGQYVAHRQILQTSARIESQLPHRPVKPYSGRKQVPTKILDEDQYPIGGYSSISNKGSIESLLHSQLAYMEPSPNDGPDLFDMKFVRDELFYYSRDENQFLRKRKAFTFVLFDDLIASRFKDNNLPCQRIVLIQSLILTSVRKLSEWLNNDALRFEIMFVQRGDKVLLDEEMKLITILLKELIERGDANVSVVQDKDAVISRIKELIKNYQVHCLNIVTEPCDIQLEGAVINQLVVNGPNPMVGYSGESVELLPGDDSMDIWQETIMRMLQLWV